MSREVEEMENVEMRRGAYSARRAEATVEDSVPRCTAHGKTVPWAAQRPLSLKRGASQQWSGRGRRRRRRRAGPRAGRELNGPVQVQGRSRFRFIQLGSSGTLSAEPLSLSASAGLASTAGTEEHGEWGRADDRRRLPQRGPKVLPE
ncbi:hypothetical protein CCHR01_19019 [Colletotrichum chrysophilum]|uniref:Uncharacterized protein n=1 Tax=Colletotrichum chrysophilum TaxID=1836956 RepID=A0AAD9A0I0_9PEZI|nr:hypothetical protein CCHR01_19019 [Colletotrichum chrysophilum]